MTARPLDALLGKADRKKEEGWPLGPLLDWLLAEGRFLADPNDLAQALAERLVLAGLPLARLRISMRTLHPLAEAWTALWDAEEGMTRDFTAPHGLESRATYQGSPLEAVQRTGEPFRRRLEEGVAEEDHHVLQELAARGLTDYLALPLPFTSGRSCALVLASGRPGGFAEADVEKLATLARVLAPVMECFAAYGLARNIASAYVGPRSGQRVLEGRIRRGDVESLEAAIWFSDLRGWSRLANELSGAEAVALANDYFALIDAAVTEAGGEVLKFIGDAVLAVFPVEPGAFASPEAACRAALAAAAGARERADEAMAVFRFGIGLHLGEIAYGNAGSPSRLDFTVMGPAVNLAARLEGLTRRLEAPVVCSRDFVEASGAGFQALGEQEIAGWPAPVPVFAPR